MRYFLITYLRKPNGQVDEQVEVTRNIKPRDQQICNVILDFKEKKCVVNSLNKEAGYDDMLEFYKRQLGDQLTPYLPQESP